jgi:DNA polymerase-4
MKTILHVDMNSFFPSVEELLNPVLKGRPVIVAVNNRRSVVSSANYEARKYGVKSAMPLYRALLLCPKAKLVEPHFEQYEKFHHEFIELIREKFTKEVEVASIDECYIDITKLVKKTSAMKIALSIQNCVKNKLGLNCSIGISNNKFLAKMASKLKKPLGITKLYKADLPTKLWPLDVGEMHMIGKVSTKFLKEHKINTIGELARLSNNAGYELFGNR